MYPDWPHAPVHRLDSQGIYIVTAATLHKNHLFADPSKLKLLEYCLLHSRNSTNGNLRLGPSFRITITLLREAVTTQQA
jgi:hypothetical protein